MKKSEIIPYLLLTLVSIFFFYKTFFLGLLPIAGDLLISEYAPWSSYSFLNYNPGSYPNKAQYFDTIRQIYPWKTLSISQIKDLKIPLWNPYNFSGSPLLANSQSAVFYPLNLLYFIFSQTFAWTILVILQPLLASFFTFLFCRELGMGKLGSFFSSVAFSYSLFMSVFLEYNTIGHVILWLPLILFSIEKLLKKISFFSIFLFVGGNVLSFFAGHLQLFGFNLLFIVLYAFFRIFFKEWEGYRKIFYFIIFLLFIFISLGISAVQLFPTFELINNSARAAQNYQFLIEKLLIQPTQLIVFLSPDFFGNPATRNLLIADTYPGNTLYIGLIPFFFSILAIIKREKEHIRFFFLASLILLLLLFIRSPVTELFYKIQIPFFSTGSPTNAIFLLSFSLSILSGFGIEAWIKKDNFFFRIAIIAGLIFFSVWLYIFLFHPQIVSTKNFFYSTLVFLIFAAITIFTLKFKLKRATAGFIFIFITIFDLFYFFQKFNPFVPAQLVFPKTKVLNWIKENAGIQRFWGYGSASIEPNFATQYSVFSPDGYDPLYPKGYGEFLYASNNGKIAQNFDNQTRSDAKVAPGYGGEDLGKNDYRIKVLNSLGVRYILDRSSKIDSEKTFSKERFRIRYEEDGWRIFENLNSSPRAFLTSYYKVAKNQNEFENIFFSKNFDPSKTIILEKELSRNFEPSKNNLKLLSYNPNEVSFETQSNKDQLLFLSDTYYPGWKAKIDGKETKIYRADYAFRAISVPKGNHQAIFRYEPQSFQLGLKITVVGIIFLSAYAVFINRLKLHGK